ncbi:N-acetyltransferase [Wenxinia marina]|uniref:Acetyltransferase n=2 Tax=Wenxinia TaxID=653686 RepID=A0A0D0QCQ4_9RHOB|nr:GNAT family N-acetyltransferase [Wenxinia marina]KIQ68708.1 Acetyltransferase [Wenxinia marina DSM 24838]GGL65880.1 N-acetyltransferase [Wenxinia marina]
MTLHQTPIREAAEADMPEIAALNVASWRSAYADLLPADYLGEPVERFLAARFGALPQTGFILLHGGPGDLQGFLYVEPGGGNRGGLDLPVGFVRAFHVRPDLKGRGIGRALFGAACARLSAGGGHGLWLEVAEENHDARAAYAALGGVDGGPFEDEIDGMPVIARRIVWRW